MKDILTSPIIKEFGKCCSNMYRLGWHERNGGNMSYLLYEDDIKEYLDLNNVIRELDTGFVCKDLIGKYFLITGTGKYFKNVEDDPETNLGIIRIKEDGTTAELLWGFKDGGRFTSETPAHLLSHATRLKINPKNRVITHCHPANIMAMTFTEELTDKNFTRIIWKYNNECIIVLPDGVGVLPWMMTGSNEIGEATAEKMKEYRIVVWANHGIYACGETLDESFGLIETVEKTAQVFEICGDKKIINPITDENLRKLVKRFDLKCREEFLD